jgi:hypothetical protein
MLKTPARVREISKRLNNATNAKCDGKKVFDVELVE